MSRAAIAAGCCCRVSALGSWPAAQPHRASRSPTSPRRRASRSPTTAAERERSGCPRRWARASPSSTPTATAGSDLLFVNSQDWEPRGRRSLPALYQQQHATARFTDITAGSGLDVEIYGMGVAVGDYDNDGRGDVYVTALEGDRLFHNEGGGQVPRRDEGLGHRQRRLRHERRLARLRPGRAARRLRRQLRPVVAEERPVVLARRRDQVVLHAGVLQGHRLEAVPQPRRRQVRGRRRRPPASPTRPASRSASRCSTTTRTAGPTSSSPTTRSRTSSIATTSDGTFAEDGLRAGVAYSEEGVARGAMGVDAADYDRSGRPHLLVGNFSNQMLGLYHNEGNGLFVDEAPRSTVGRAQPAHARLRRLLLRLRPRRLARHLRRPTGTSRKRSAASSRRLPYKQPPLLFRNLGARGFEHVTPTLGAELLASDRRARRGLRRLRPRRRSRTSSLTTNHGPAYLYRNDGGNRQQLARRPHSRDEVEPRRHRRRRAGDERRRPAVADGPERLELRVAERFGADVRSGHELDTGIGRGRVAERRPRSRRGRIHAPVDPHRRGPRAGPRADKSDVVEAWRRPVAAMCSTSSSSKDRPIRRETTTASRQAAEHTARHTAGGGLVLANGLGERSFRPYVHELR